MVGNTNKKSKQHSHSIVVVSVSTTFFNKAVLSVYEFKATNTILLAQHILSLVVLSCLRALGMIEYPNPEWEKCKILLPVSLLYSLNVGVALTGTSPPFFVLIKASTDRFEHPDVWVWWFHSSFLKLQSVLKRMSTLYVLVGERIILGKESSTSLKQSVFVIVAGALIAGRLRMCCC